MAVNIDVPQVLEEFPGESVFWHHCALQRRL